MSEELPRCPQRCHVWYNFHPLPGISSNWARQLIVTWSSLYEVQHRHTGEHAWETVFLWCDNVRWINKFAWTSFSKSNEVLVTRAPPHGPISFTSMQFSAKILPSNRLARLLLGLAHLPLDPPLLHISNYCTGKLFSMNFYCAGNQFQDLLDFPSHFWVFFHYF